MGITFSNTMFCISRNSVSSWFNIFVSVYASTVVLDSISENLVQIAAKPNQTCLNSLKLCAYGILTCACCQQILRGISRQLSVSFVHSASQHSCYTLSNEWLQQSLTGHTATSGLTSPSMN